MTAQLDVLNPKGGSAKNVIMAAAITAANGGDNIAVYVPLFIEKSWPEGRAHHGRILDPDCRLVLHGTLHRGPPPRIARSRFNPSWAPFLPWLLVMPGALPPAREPRIHASGGRDPAIIRPSRLGPHQPGRYLASWPLANSSAWTSVAENDTSTS